MSATVDIDLAEPVSPLPEGPPPGDLAPARRRGLLHALTHGRGLVGLGLVGIVVALGLLAPLLAPYAPNEQVRDANLLGPSGAHWLGTDEVNRDLLSRTLYGIRADLVVVFAAVPIGAALGVLIGLVTSWWAWTDVLAQRAFDLLLAFPALILGVLVTAFLGPGLFTVGVVIVAIEVPVFGRLVRTSVRNVREMPFVEAAQLAGAAHRPARGLDVGRRVHRGRDELPRPGRPASQPVPGLAHQGRRPAHVRRPVLRRRTAGARRRARPRPAPHLPVPRGGPSCLSPTSPVPRSCRHRC
jgi:hypothetical protein